MWSTEHIITGVADFFGDIQSFPMLFLPLYGQQMAKVFFILNPFVSFGPMITLLSDLFLIQMKSMKWQNTVAEIVHLKEVTAGKCRVCRRFTHYKRANLQKISNVIRFTFWYNKYYPALIPPIESAFTVLLISKLWLKNSTLAPNCENWCQFSQLCFAFATAFRNTIFKRLAQKINSFEWTSTNQSHINEVSKWAMNYRQGGAIIRLRSDENANAYKCNNDDSTFASKYLESLCILQERRTAHTKLSWTWS